MVTIYITMKVKFWGMGSMLQCCRKFKNESQLYMASTFCRGATMMQCSDDASSHCSNAAMLWWCRGAVSQWHQWSSAAGCQV